MKTEGPSALPSLPDTPAVPSRSQAERRERAVADALRTLIRDLHLDRFGAAPERMGTIDLALRARVTPGENWALSFDPPLAEQVGRQIEEVQAAHSVYRPGRVWCFRCESAECGHAAPPSAVSVFKAYTATGLPEWQDLHQAFIAAQDPRVDRLFASAPETLALVQLGHALRQDQLSSFGRSSKTYAILGQVVAGYFQLPRRLAGRDETRRLAITFQVVETRGRAGGLELRLNTLAGVPAGVDLDDLFAEEWESWAFRARELAARVLAAMTERAEAARRTRRAEELQAVMRRVPTVLRRLAEFLDRGHRQGRRRTLHVEDRRRHDGRPVHKALDDARTAAAEAVYVDERSGTLVVCGAQGRAHVFNPEGRHVTSFVLGPGDFDLRLRTRRWRRATPEESAGLRQKLQAGTSSPDD
jgi:hypothetical protein